MGLSKAMYGSLMSAAWAEYHTAKSSLTFGYVASAQTHGALLRRGLVEVLEVPNGRVTRLTKAGATALG